MRRKFQWPWRTEKVVNMLSEYNDEMELPEDILPNFVCSRKDSILLFSTYAIIIAPLRQLVLRLLRF